MQHDIHLHELRTEQEEEVEYWHYNTVSRPHWSPRQEIQPLHDYKMSPTIMSPKGQTSPQLHTETQYGW